MGVPNASSVGLTTGRRLSIALPWAVVPPSALFGAGLLLFWGPLRGVRMDQMNGYGLISVLPIATLAGAGLMTLGFMLALRLGRPHRLMLGCQLAATVISLHGVAPALEPVARFPTAWQHTAFIEYIVRTGSVDTGLDARFSWPGFFALIGFVTHAVGVQNLEPILHVSSVVTQLLFLAPLYLILRVMRVSWRAKWLAAWLFVVADWVGQDFLSPQAFGYLMYLTFIGVLLNWFLPRPLHPAADPERRGRIARFLRFPTSSGEQPVGAAGVGERAVMLLVLLVVFTMTTVSHQLTPFVVLLACSALVILRRCTARGLPVLLAVIVVGWVSFMAAAYWTGHLNVLFGGVGHFGANVDSSVSDRVNDSSPQLARIQQVRILLAASVVGLVAVGVLRRWLRRIDDRVALVLCFVPCLTLGLQSYGGEIALRIYLFMLPGACILAAYAFFPGASGTARCKPLALTAATLCGLVLVGGFLTVRFGNEKFEEIKPGDLKVQDALLRDAPGTVTFVWLRPQIPRGNAPLVWVYRGIERYNYSALNVPPNPDDITPVIEALRKPGSYFVTTRAQEAFLQYNYSLPASYGDRLRAALAASPALRTVYRDGEAAAYTLRKPPPGHPPPPPPPRPPTVGMTKLTPFGIAAAVLLIVTLTGREMRRLRQPPGLDRITRRRRRSAPPPLWSFTTLVVGATLIMFVAVIVERFVVLGN